MSRVAIISHGIDHAVCQQWQDFRHLALYLADSPSSYFPFKFFGEKFVLLTRITPELLDKSFRVDLCAKIYQLEISRIQLMGKRIQIFWIKFLVGIAQITTGHDFYHMRGNQATKIFVVIQGINHLKRLRRVDQSTVQNRKNLCVL